MQLIKFTNPNNKYTIKRNNYFIFKCFFSDFSSTEKKIIEMDTINLITNSSFKSANSGSIRELHIKNLDVYTGIIAEVITKKMFNEVFNINAIRPEVKETKNQIDIILNTINKDYTVEVRSSMVRNGIEFALFAGKHGIPYFDIIGPYCQIGYKKNFESVKDIYMRVLFDTKGFNSHNNIYNEILESKLPFYIIGGVSGKNIQQANKTKTMNNTYVKNPGIYYYLGIDEIFDCNDLIILLNQLIN